MARHEEAQIPLNVINKDETRIPLKSRVYYRNLFDRVDANKNSFVTFNELKAFLDEERGKAQGHVPKNVIVQIYKEADTNGDGRLNFDEFYTMINNPKLQHIFGQYVYKYVNFIIPPEPRRQVTARKREQELEEEFIFYEDHYSCCPPPLGMIIISIVEFIFFLVDELVEKDSTKFARGPMAKIFIFHPSKRDEVWRFLTYMFVHIGNLHLIVNLTVQIFLGIPLEMVHGGWRILLIYTAGVVAGSFATSITDPTALLAGASGGVYSLITAHIASIIMNWQEMSYPAIQLLIFLIITISDLGSAIYNRFFLNTNENIGYVAHIAGAVAGLLVGINVLRNFKRTKTEEYIWWISIVLYVGLMLFAICWNIFYTDFFPKAL